MTGRHANQRHDIALVDACTLQNFAVVGALWVLEKRFGGIITWTEAVEYEVRRGLVAQPALKLVLDSKWLGLPLRLDQPGDHVVDLIRRGLGGRDDNPLQHLGEAESIRALERADFSRRVLLTDDGPAADFARRRPSGIRVLDSADILAEAYAMDDLRCPDAYDFLLAMANHPTDPRPVRVPTHRDVC